MIFNLLRKLTLSLLFVILFTTHCRADNHEQHINNALRTVGHELLLQTGDSTSRILPIEKEANRYKITFEKEFGFIPAMLSYAIYTVIDENKLVKSYIVEVEDCVNHKVVYSYEISSKKDDSTVPCKARELPIDCYIIYFTVLEAGNILPTNKGQQIANFNTYYILILVAAILGLIIYFVKKNKQLKLNPNLINIGQFQFDQKAMTLLLKAQAIELSAKESDLLFLLFTNENKTLEREYILNIVWGDEGDYVGRTLDVFISKLRKKLEADSSLKIINVRGVGYRFVIKH